MSALWLSLVLLLCSPTPRALPALGQGPPGSAPQPQTVLAGYVTAPDSVPLAGVSVLIQGTLTGTTTNAEGRFLLPATPLPCTLVFTLAGHATKTVAVTEAADLLAPVVLRSVLAAPARKARRQRP